MEAKIEDMKKDKEAAEEQASKEEEKFATENISRQKEATAAKEKELKGI